MKRFGLILLLLVSASCRREQPIPQNSMWSGTVQLSAGVVLPFQMSLDLSGAMPKGYFLIGDERAPIPEIVMNGNDLTFRFSEYGAEMRGTWTGHEWSGNYLRIRSNGTKSFPFAATPEAAPSSPVRIESPPVGNYQVDETTVAKLWTKDFALYGTMIAPDGDYGLLEGSPSGRGIQLSRFTGWQAIAITLAPASDGSLSGTFYAAANDKPKDIVLRPRAGLNVELPVSKQTAMKDPHAEFAFSGVSISGETIRNTDERFKGKALILDIMGTWCHNCLDGAPLLEQLEQQYGKDGVEVVGLSFEISDDPALAKKNLQLYKDRFGLTYTLLFCGSLDEGNVNQRINSQLDHFFAYPTTIFVDRNHKVRSVHSGFKGPGTGDEYQSQIKEFHELTEKLLTGN